MREKDESYSGLFEVVSLLLVHDLTKQNAHKQACGDRSRCVRCRRGNTQRGIQIPLADPKNASVKKVC
jgi:hypothetical protein